MWGVIQAFSQHDWLQLRLYSSYNLSEGVVKKEGYTCSLYSYPSEKLFVCSNLVRNYCTKTNTIDARISVLDSGAGLLLQAMPLGCLHCLGGRKLDGYEIMG